MELYIMIIFLYSVRVFRKTRIEMYKLKPYLKKDNFYRYLFD